MNNIKHLKAISFASFLLVLVLWSTHSVFAQSIDTIYDRPPDVAACDPGVLKESEKLAALDYVNQIRALHNLEPVIYDKQYDEETAQASLLIVANNNMDHTPSESAKCYSEAGYAGSSTSNLYIRYPYEMDGEPLYTHATDSVRGWLIDEGVYGLGHRRWMLDPFLQKISYGQVDGIPGGYDAGYMAYGATIKVIYEERDLQLPITAPEFVAYPYGEYPLELFGINWYWSFSVVSDVSSRWNTRNVDFANATIRISEAGSDDLVVNNIGYNNDGMGIANILFWQVGNVELETSYHVEIRNVIVNGEPKDYEYDVKITKPYFDKLDLPVFENPQSGDVLEITSGEAFAVFVQPPDSLEPSYQYSDLNLRIESILQSPYVNLFRIEGAVNSEVSLYLASGGTITARITDSNIGPKGTQSRPAEILESEPLNAPTFKQSEMPTPTAISVEPPAQCEEAIAVKPSTSGEVLVTSRLDENRFQLISSQGQLRRTYSEEVDQDSLPAWSPDGSMIAFVSGSRLYTIDESGENLKQLSELEAFASTPAWSPDGQWIAFSVTPSADGIMQFGGGAAEIYLIQPDGSNLRRLTQDERHDYNPVWSPLGTQIAYHSNPVPPHGFTPFDITDIVILNLTDGSHVQLGYPEHHSLDPVWSPDGTHLAYVKAPYSQSLFPDPVIYNEHIILVDADGTNPFQLSPDSVRAVSPNWSPDGKWIAFGTLAAFGEEYGDISGTVFTIKPDRSCWSQQIPASLEQGYDVVTWSPDGGQILIRAAAPKDGYLAINVLDVVANTQEVVIDHLDPGWSFPQFYKPAWRPHCPIASGTCQLPTIPILQQLTEQEFVITSEEANSATESSTSTFTTTLPPPNPINFASAPFTIERENEAVALTVADFNHDLYGDVALLDAEGAITIFVGNDDGSLRQSVSYPVEAAFPRLLVGDVNGDKEMDIVAFSNSLDTRDKSYPFFVVLFGTGEAIFTPVKQWIDGEISVPIGIGDMNQDGQDDIVSFDAVSNMVLYSGGLTVVYSWEAQGEFQVLSQIAAGGGVTLQSIIADVDKDGLLDIVLNSSIYYGNGKAELPYHYLLQSEDNGNKQDLQHYLLQLADLNNDQILDVIAGSIEDETSESSQLQILLSNEPRSYVQKEPISLNSKAEALYFFDANQDSLTDILTANGNPLTLELLLNQGDGAFDKAMLPAFAEENASEIAIADINNDGQPDLVYLAAETYALSAWLSGTNANASNPITQQNENSTPAQADELTQASEAQPTSTASKSATDSSILPTPTAEPQPTSQEESSETPVAEATSTVLPPEVQATESTASPLSLLLFCGARDFDTNRNACNRSQDTFTSPVTIVYASWNEMTQNPGTQFRRIWYLNGVRFLERENANTYAYVEVGSSPNLTSGRYRMDLFADGELIVSKEFEIR